MRIIRSRPSRPSLVRIDSAPYRSFEGLKVIEALSTTRFLQRGQVGIILILGFTKLQQTRMNRSSAQGRGDALGQACLKQRRLREAKAPPLLIKIMCAAVYTSDTSRAQPFSHGRRGSVLR